MAKKKEVNYLPIVLPVLVFIVVLLTIYIPGLGPWHTVATLWGVGLINTLSFGLFNEYDIFVGIMALWFVLLNVSIILSHLILKEGRGILSQ